MTRLAARMTVGFISSAITILLMALIQSGAIAQEPKPKAVDKTPAPIQREDPLLAEWLEAKHTLRVTALASAMTGTPSTDADTGSRRLIELYTKIVDRPDVVQRVVALQVYSLESGRAESKNVYQAQQAALDSMANIAVLQAIQNQRIIDLLKQLNSAKTAR